MSTIPTPPPLPVTPTCTISDMLSRERLQWYLETAKHDPQQALRLYALGIELAAALYPSLHLFEVALRNRFAVALEDLYGSKWYASEKLYEKLRKYSQADLAEAVIRALKLKTNSAEAQTLRTAQPTDWTAAINSATKNAANLNPGKVVAELSLGFWTGLLSRKYQDAFWKHWQKLFPHQDLCDSASDPSCQKTLEETLREPLDRLRRLRNRVFHHEPLLKELKELEDNHHWARRLLRWMYPDVETWLETQKLDPFPSVYRRIHAEVRQLRSSTPHPAPKHRRRPRGLLGKTS